MGKTDETQGLKLYTVITTIIKKHTVWAHSEEEAMDKAAKKPSRMPYDVTKDIEVLKR